MDTITYKGYQIHPTPYQLADSGQWTINIHVAVEGEGQTKWRKFGAGNTFETKQEAIQRCLNFGRRIIDGQVSEWTVSDS